ncbi:unnamed protein product [Alopecurus aequalis]
MGNCLDRPRGRRAAAHYAKKKSAAVPIVEGEEVEKAPAPAKEVKIRITRKQLEDLLRRLEQEDGAGGGAAVVSELLCMTSSCNFRHRGQAGQWSPALQTILE